MLRGDPLRVDIPGYTPRVVATADRTFVLVIAEIERTAEGLRKPRRLYAFDWSGRPIWTRDLDEGPAGPRVAADGLLWLAEPAALVGLDADGATVRRIDVVLPPDECLGAFVGLADGGFHGRCGSFPSIYPGSPLGRGHATAADRETGRARCADVTCRRRKRHDSRGRRSARCFAGAPWQGLFRQDGLRRLDPCAHR